jgi:hypothetical protein
VDQTDGRRPGRQAESKREGGRPVTVVVSVADDRLDELAEVVAELRRAGLRVDEVLDTVGMVTGTVDEDAVSALGSVPGVIEVERQRAYQVAPPESDIQ